MKIKQDSSVKIWSTDSNAIVVTLNDFDRDYECLRVAWSSFTWGQGRNSDCLETKTFPIPIQYNKENLFLATGGADGRAKLWRPFKQIVPLAILDFHNEYNTDDQVQIYCLQFIEKWLHRKNVPYKALLTSENDYLHVWSPTPLDASDVGISSVLKESLIQMHRIWSFRFEQNHIDSAAFGGDRNPNRINYVFDASFCEETYILAVALSDGTIRLLDGLRGIYLAILEFPRTETRFHLSGLSWNKNGTKLATCLSLGQICLWDVHVAKANDILSERSVEITNTLTLDGGHEVGRAVFGAIFVQDSDSYSSNQFLISWGVDGKICAWDSTMSGHVTTPLITLVDRPEYPAYAVDISYKGKISENGEVKLHLSIGGGSGGGFIGVPAYLYDVTIPKGDFLNKLTID